MHNKIFKFFCFEYIQMSYLEKKQKYIKLYLEQISIDSELCIDAIPLKKEWFYRIFRANRKNAPYDNIFALLLVNLSTTFTSSHSMVKIEK